MGKLSDFENRRRLSQTVAEESWMLAYKTTICGDKAKLVDNPGKLEAEHALYWGKLNEGGIAGSDRTECGEEVVERDG